ncbi:MAG: hypothetical protein ACI8PB_000261 [Desulforhopalus sp.]
MPERNNLAISNRFVTEPYAVPRETSAMLFYDNGLGLFFALLLLLLFKNNNINIKKILFIAKKNGSKHFTFAPSNGLGRAKLRKRLYREAIHG